ADLRGVGVDIVTVGQYLRPTSNHLPVARWWRPEEFESVKLAGEAMGIPHVEASPLTRSSYHARQAAEGAVAGESAAHAGTAPAGAAPAGAAPAGAAPAGPVRAGPRPSSPVPVGSTPAPPVLPGAPKSA
ncbi:MAG TPA: hypothetical protein VMO88_13960, partial [Acidimicrobiales bacterium]|nr:hypothetical protein [Acidimicrobiales bacterium]